MTPAEACDLLHVSQAAIQRIAQLGNAELARVELEKYKRSVNATFRQLARRFHPDHNPGREEDFKLLSSINDEVQKLQVIVQPRMPPPRVVYRRVVYSSASTASTTASTFDFGGVYTFVTF